MATKGKRRKASKVKRTHRVTYKHIGKATRKQISEMSRFIPSLAKLKGKQRITSAEYSAVTRAKKKLRHTENLRPVTAKQAKELRKRGLLAGNGIQAIRLRSTAENAKVRVHKDGVVVTSNGRTFEYHPVKPDIDALADVGERLLDRRDVKQIFLWTSRGRTDEGFTYFGEGEDDGGWLAYLQSRFSQYHQISDFTEGVAAEIKSTKGKTKDGRT